MSNDFNFQILEPKCGLGLKEQLEELEILLFHLLCQEMVTAEQLLQTRIYLTDAANQLRFVEDSNLYKEYLSKGAISYIQQPLLSGAKVALQVCFTKRDDIIKSGSSECLQVQMGGITLLFHSVRFAVEDVRNMDSEKQTMLAFRKHMECLAPLGMTLEENCHRTWIYVRDIDRHYAGVVNGRNKVFEKEGLTAETHYIASTGIGGYCDNRVAAVAVDFLSVQGIGREDIQYLHALDYLNPTHEYGVAFERGTKLTLPNCAVSFISGTASIDKNGEVLHCGDVMTQAGRLFLNIEKLLNDGGQGLLDVQFFLVYLRDIADYHNINRYLHLRFPHTPFLIFEAPVCRPEWLIEVECIAMQG